MQMPTSSTMLWIVLAFVSAIVAEPVTLLSAEPPYTECVDSVLTWRGGVPPYRVRAKTPSAKGGDQLRTIAQYLNETTYKFFVDVPGGTQLDIWIEDTVGERGEPGHNSIKNYVRTHPNPNCPLYLFPGDKVNDSSTASPVTVTTTLTPSSTLGFDSEGSGSVPAANGRTGQIVGGVVGGVVGLLLLLGLLLWIWRLRRQLRGNQAQKYETIENTNDGSAYDTMIRSSTLQHSLFDGGTGHHTLTGDGTPRPALAGNVTYQQSVARAPLPESAPEPSPEMKVLQLDAMFGSQPTASPQPSQSPQPSPSLSFDSPSLQERGAGSPVAPPARGSVGAAPTPTEERLSHQNPSLGHESEYAEDAGPAFAPPLRTIHPPQYRDTWKN